VSLAPPVRYLSVADVVALHFEIMKRLGDQPRPLAHRAKLESALMRPAFAFQYSQADLIRQAAVLAVGISQAQAWEDGNKRTAYMTMRVFLRKNGWRFVGRQLELADHLIAIAERPDTLDDATHRFESWLRQHVVRDT
jgi:death on curing protein